MAEAEGGRRELVCDDGADGGVVHVGVSVAEWQQTVPSHAFLTCRGHEGGLSSTELLKA